MSSDIAHELKTPIAELRNLSEVGARWPEDRQAVRQFFEDARAIAQHMERVVAHLLALARYDEGRERLWTAPVQVAEIVDGAWKPLAREAAARELHLRPPGWSCPPASVGRPGSSRRAADGKKDARSSGNLQAAPSRSPL
jgi:signal transduction histidine kinase